MKSVLSFPERGPWGDAKWRGNTSGYVIKELIAHFKPKTFVDICEGSGTSRDVCKDLGIKYVGLDLRQGFNFVKDYLLSKLGYQADMVFSHPPYWDIIKYSGIVWGDKENDADLSYVQSYDEFLEKCQVMLLNQREATKPGKYYVCLIGDIRKQGRFYSPQADFIKLMPSDELISVTVKIQHNVNSARKTYSGNFVPIFHEYLLIWQKKNKILCQITADIVKDFRRKTRTTWKNFIRVVLMKLGGKANLATIYKIVEQEGHALLQKNKHWKAKVRQTLQIYPDFQRIDKGVWGLI